MKGRAHLPFCFEMFTLGSVFLFLREAFQTLRLFILLVLNVCHSTHGIVASMNYTDSECPSQQHLEKPLRRTSSALSFLYSDASTLMLLQRKLFKDEGLAMYLRSCCREQLMGADFQLIETVVAL